MPNRKAWEPVLGEYSNLGMYKPMHAGIDAASQPLKAVTSGRESWELPYSLVPL